MTTKRNAPLKWSLGEANQGTVDVSHNTGITPIYQQIRLPSSTRHYLKMYRDDLSQYSDNDDALIMIQLVTALLDSDDLLAGVI